MCVDLCTPGRTLPWAASPHLGGRALDEGALSALEFLTWWVSSYPTPAPAVLAAALSTMLLHPGLSPPVLTVRCADPMEAHGVLSVSCLSAPGHMWDTHLNLVVPWACHLLECPFSRCAICCLFLLDFVCFIVDGSSTCSGVMEFVSSSWLCHLQPTADGVRHCFVLCSSFSKGFDLSHLFLCSCRFLLSLSHTGFCPRDPHSQPPSADHLPTPRLTHPLSHLQSFMEENPLLPARPQPHPGSYPPSRSTSLTILAPPSNFLSLWSLGVQPAYLLI